MSHYSSLETFDTKVIINPGWEIESASINGMQIQEPSEKWYFFEMQILGGVCSRGMHNEIAL